MISEISHHNQENTTRYPVLSVIMIAFALSFVACSDIFVENAYTRTIKHYSSPDDSLKQRAVQFLSEYAGYHYGIPRYLIDADGNRVTHMQPYQFSSDTVYRHYLDSLGYHFHADEPIRDLDAITPEYLINNIELAFAAWQNPWAKDVSFDDFCRYILPYRNATEDLSDWRHVFKLRYEQLINDSTNHSTDLRTVVRFMMRQLGRDMQYGTQLRDFYQNFLTPQQSEMMYTMGCQGLAHYATLALRACGIPCAMIDIGWRFTDVNHSSVLFPAVGTNDSVFRVSIHDSWQEMPQAKDSMASWRTMRYSYEVNPDLLEIQNDPETVPGYGNPVTRIDVTAQMSTTRTLTLSIPAEYRERKHLYLCRFKNWRWIPIREGKVRGDSVVFLNTTIRQWYRLASMDGEKTIPFGGTFTLHGDGSIYPYDGNGDTVMFKMVYGCQPNETRLRRQVTTYYWGAQNDWNALTQEAILWGLNKETGEYRVFDESMRNDFTPVFHLLTVYLPCRTVFFDNETPRPLGYIATDPETGEGYFQQY